MRKIAFDAVVFLRTDKESEAGGHPVDRIELNNFVKAEFVKEDYESSASGFLKFTKDIDEKVDKFLWSIFDTKVIFGDTLPIGGANSEHSSEHHVIRVADIRNIVLLAYQETKMHFFEQEFDITF